MKRLCRVLSDIFDARGGRFIHLPHASLPDTGFDLRSSLVSVRSWWGYHHTAASQLSNCHPGK
ncbi:hypothetical protein [uncultured Duncaniella sp.]|uniref:hypothetical protein n=1 Tax=uncultured Duncaniella sp. TaxID=2768039 RepID=UPI00262EA2E2|nr:hypothetical protein [uncultured Duncaniella sp.]